MRGEPLRDFDHGQRESLPDIVFDEERVARHMLRRILNKLAQIFALTKPRDSDEECARAGGGCVCKLCGETYSDHANDPREPWMTMLCDGRRVKL